MNISIYEKTALFEHRFWLQILGDHARFIFHALSPKEVEKIQTAQYFINVFDKLLMESRQNLSGARLTMLNQQALSYAEEIKAFKLELIRLHLEGKIIIELPPTFINHMVNEVEKYFMVLSYLVE